MIVLPTSKNIGYPDDFRKFFNFKKFEKICGDFVLVEGYFEQAHQWEQFNLSKNELNNILKKRIVRIEIEEPNKFALNDNPDNYDKYFYKIFTICPYTAKWLNKRQKNNKRKPIYYPFNEKYIPPKRNKIYDIIYVGNIVAKKVINDINIISKYNYCFVSFANNNLVTHRNVSYINKLKLISQSKIALVHNLLFPNPFRTINIWRAKNWDKNEAFKYLPHWYEFWKLFTNKNIIIPQIKSRLFESAFCRSLILCEKDPFNLIERFFEPDKEFIYYERGQLDKKIKQILKNYENYEFIVENAYKKAVKNYTTKAFVKNYLSKI